MASAVWDVNRLPLSRKAAGVAEAFVSVILAPWTPPLIVESVTEIGVLLATMPSVLVEAKVLRETSRPKLDEVSVDVAPFVMLIPVAAYRTAALNTDPFAALPDRLMPAQSPGAAEAQPGRSTDGQATTPALLSLRLVKTFCTLDADRKST